MPEAPIHEDGYLMPPKHYVCSSSLDSFYRTINSIAQSEAMHLRPEYELWSGITSSYRPHSTPYLD